MKLGGGVKSKFAQNSNCSVVTHGSQPWAAVCVCVYEACEASREKKELKHVAVDSFYFVRIKPVGRCVLIQNRKREAGELSAKIDFVTRRRSPILEVN